LIPTLQAAPFGLLSAGIGCQPPAKKPQRGFFLPFALSGSSPVLFLHKAKTDTEKSVSVLLVRMTGLARLRAVRGRALTAI